MNPLAKNLKENNHKIENYPGNLVFIVGNSGSGKDSIIDYVKTHWESSLPNLSVPLRYITRPAHESEPFRSVSQEEFHSLEDEDFFLFQWNSYHTNYGVSKKVMENLQHGDVVIVNVSRSIIPEVKKQFPKLKVVSVQVPLDITVQRIKERGRENTNSQGFQDRIDRSKKLLHFNQADVEIENSGTIAQAGDTFKDILLNYISNR